MTYWTGPVTRWSGPVTYWTELDWTNDLLD